MVREELRKYPTSQVEQLVVDAHWEQLKPQGEQTPPLRKDPTLQAKQTVELQWVQPEGQTVQVFPVRLYPSMQLVQ